MTTPQRALRSGSLPPAANLLQCFSLVWDKEPHLDRRVALDARHEFMDLKFDRCGLELSVPAPLPFFTPS